MARVQPDITVLIQPRDALVLRDARPFFSDPGSRAFSLPWPMPRTIAGALRSHIVRQSQPNPAWNASMAQEARGYVVHGPMLVAQHERGGKWDPYVPAPKDIVPMEDGSVMILRPDMNLPEDAGTDLPSSANTDSAKGKSYRAAMQNVCLYPMNVSSNGKPKKDVPAFWAIERAASYLGENGSEATAQACLSEGLSALPLKERVHVSVDSKKRTAIEGALFTTEAREFAPDPVDADLAQLVKRLRREGTIDPNAKESDLIPAPALAMIARIGAAPEGALEQPSFASIGGERRLVRVSTPMQDQLWPEPVVPDASVLQGVKRLRLQLVTPAIFAHGWLPAWMGEGVIPGLGSKNLGGVGFHVKLVGVASDRPIPVSGWRLSARAADSVNNRKATPAGPKETLLAVPAGAVYFFEITKGEITEDIWRRLWLAPVSDFDLHANEGFGLVLPGIW